VDVPAYLPDDYIPDTGHRLALYRRLAQAGAEAEVDALVGEIEDRYGPLPEEVSLLSRVMAQKTVVRALGARAYELGPARMVLTLGLDARLDPARVMRLVQRKDSRWKLTPDMRLSYGFNEEEQRDHLRAATAHLAEVLACRPTP
jgi:transcription-repair coupling factor (superfamily II helicase)